MSWTRKSRTLRGWAVWYALFLAMFLASAFFDMPDWLFWLAYGVFILGGLSLLAPSYASCLCTAGCRCTDDERQPDRHENGGRDA